MKKKIIAIVLADDIEINTDLKKAEHIAQVAVDTLTAINSEMRKWASISMRDLKIYEKTINALKYIKDLKGKK